MGYISIRRGVSSLLIVAPSLTQALRVSPNSPCTSVCTDSNISQSDPTFFDEQWKDIVCTDTALDSTPQGKKLESCFTCLQNSTYTHGSESDQDWFLYNLRYSASYCMFGYPNSTGFDSGPCTTTVGCGSLSDALELSIKNPTSLTPYDYCDVNGGAITSNQVQGCLQCIQADGEHDYMSNFLLALQGACQVKPASDSVLVLNKPLFGNDTVQVVTSSPSSDNQGPAISTSTIVGIVVGGVVLLALIAAFTFVCIRKRKNRAKEQDRASGYSFRCQTRVTPVTPRFPEGAQIDDNFQGNEKAHVMVTNGIPIGANAYPQAQYPWNSQSSLNVAISRQDSATMRPSVITSLPPPPSAHISPRLGSPDDYSTPASAVSTRSSAPLLANPQRGYSPSPHLAQSSWSLSPRPNRLDKRWEDENQGFGNALGLVSKKKNQTNAASPVQSEVIQTSFPPPPTK